MSVGRRIAWPLVMMIGGLVVMVVSAAGPAVYVLVINPGLLTPRHRFAVPGSVTFTPEGATVGIYVETRSVIDGREVRGPGTIPGLQVRVTDSAGRAVPVNLDPSSSASYALPRHEGELVATAAVGLSGPVTVEATAGTGRAGAHGTPVIAVGEGFGGRQFGTIMGMALGAFMGMALGALCVGLTGLGLGIGGLVWLIVRLGRREGAA